MGALSRIGKKTTEKQTVDEQAEQYLTFVLGSDVFAVPVLKIREVIEYPSVTAVPMTPSFIRGVTNVRGSVLPIIDLSARFGRDSSQNTKRTCVVIVEVTKEEDKQEIGMVVDQVNSVFEIPRKDIALPPDFGMKIRTDFINGVCRLGDRFVIILDVDRVLSFSDLAIIDDVIQHSVLAESSMNTEP
jgi:purine-binding chemotaxis protein CheW